MYKDKKIVSADEFIRQATSGVFEMLQLTGDEFGSENLVLSAITKNDKCIECSETGRIAQITFNLLREIHKKPMDDTIRSIDISGITKLKNLDLIMKDVFSNTKNYIVFKSKYETILPEKDSFEDYISDKEEQRGFKSLETIIENLKAIKYGYPHTIKYVESLKQSISDLLIHTATEMDRFESSNDKK